MAHGSGTLDWTLELLAPLGVVRARRMFGGHGLTLDGLFIALLAGDELFLKADAQEQAAFAAAGSCPFSFTRPGKTPVVMAYWRAPDEAMESPAGMAPWARRALASALRAAAAKAAAPPAKARAAAKSKPASNPPSTPPGTPPSDRPRARSSAAAGGSTKPARRKG